MENYTQLFGESRRIISDRGTAFTSKNFEKFVTQHGIQHTLVSVRYPQANGQVEGVNSTLVPVLQANMRDDRNWDKNIGDAER